MARIARRSSRGSKSRPVDPRHPKARKRVGPEKWAAWLEAHAGVARVYRPFVKPGDLVFDVGANRGIKTYALQKMGAKVVAIEPLAGHPTNLVPHLKHVFGDDPDVQIVSKALGPEEGTVTLWAHGVFPGYSSTNRSWIRTREHAYSVAEITVPVTTLDILIERFGEPVFIKIDVEGGENKVLAGLSRPIAALNFEFHKFLLGVAMKCITHLEELGTYEYNYVHAVDDRFALGRWEGAEQIRKTLAALPMKGSDSWGDIYARLRSRQPGKATSSTLPVDVLIPVVDKDLPVLPYAIDGVRENLKHPIKKIIVVAPHSKGIEKLCREKGCEFVWEDFVLPITKKDIDYTVAGMDRSGWLYQQFLKWNGDRICGEDHYLVLDADTILLRPQVFEIGGKTVLLNSDEHHQPYWDVYKRLFGKDAPSQKSFTSHHMLYSKTRICELKEQIWARHGHSWWEVILGIIDRSECAATSGYELYGQWMLQNHPDEVVQEYWHNKLLRRSQLCELNRIKRQLADEYRSITFHSHMR